MQDFKMSGYKYVDFHSHMHDKAFEPDIENIMQDLINKKIAVVTVGTDLEESKKAKELSDKYDNVYYTIGVHPNDNMDADFVAEEFTKLLGPKCIAIGECGLEYFTLEKDLEKGNIDSFTKEKERQENLFKKQIEFALEYDLPLMIHGRPSKEDDAYDDILKTLQEYIDKGNSIRANMHFFAGSKDIARKCLNQGFTFSFGGVLTLTSDYDEVIKSIPLEHIHAETDAPYVSPKNIEGQKVNKRNSSQYIDIIVSKIAELKGVTVEECKDILIDNFIRFTK